MKAVVTGVSGQDGSYLAELLLDKGYEVTGVVRRSANEDLSRIAEIIENPRLKLVYGDITEPQFIANLVGEKPHEFYNLAAQSFVGYSFENPVSTFEVNATAVIHMLSAIEKYSRDTKFYQASTSEMYGGFTGTAPQNEITYFKPQSPYGAAKLAAHNMVRLARDRGIFACAGILFNHECISSRTPLIIKRNGHLDVVTADEIVSVRSKGSNVQQFEPIGVEVYDGRSFVPLKFVTATKRRVADKDHQMKSVEARAGVVEATAHHGMLDSDSERRRADSFAAGDKVLLAEEYPESPAWSSISEEMAELLGYLVAEGYVPDGRQTIQFTGNNEQLRKRVAELWSRLFLMSSMEYVGSSGFSDKSVGQLNLNASKPLAAWLRQQIYTKHGLKKVPQLIINATTEVQSKFLSAYYSGDGLKAGNGMSFTTNSPVLAQGLCWLYALQGRKASVYAEHRGEAAYYRANLSGDLSLKGQHLRKDPSEVRKVVEAPDSEWVFDLETESNVFMAGVGRVIVHNSERRGKEFVTQKICEQCVEIWAGKRDKIKMGWLGAQRDWGYAPEYVEGMWKMLQHSQAGDYVLATGTTYTVQQFLEWVCELLDLDWQKVYKQDPRFMRPNEVKLLKGNSNKAQTELSWQPKIFGKSLAVQMLAGALNRYPLGEAKMLAGSLLIDHAKEIADAPTS